jgi:hypothetical protein
MQRQTRPISLLFLASATIDGIAACNVDQSGHFRGMPNLYEIALLALVLSQVSLVSIWLALGRTASSLRMLCSVGVIMLLSCAPLLVSSRYHGRVVLLFGVGGIVAVCLLVARTLGLRCVHELDRDSKSGHARWQFSIIQLLVWTAALAVLLGLFKWTGFFDAFSPEVSISVAGMLFLGPGRALVTFAALWMMLGRGIPIRRAPALIVAEIASLALPTVLFHMPGRNEMGTLVSFMAVEAAVFVGTLLVFRKIGYRVRWNKRGAATESGVRLPDAGDQPDLLRQ